ncbi:hypothetical protein ACEN19_00205 [Corynebacterium auriscanis]|uniref:hypothetical protein n=1 Tax=Corynebacterium auriscanis TaxID=99807 RepID=UPI0025F454B5|nr:hypothetical protein [uncultured Corynebacterium sp.]
MNPEPQPPPHRIDPIVQEGIDLDEFAKALVLIALDAQQSAKRRRRRKKTPKKSQPTGKKGEQP